MMRVAGRFPEAGAFCAPVSDLWSHGAQIEAWALDLGPSLVGLSWSWPQKGEGWLNAAEPEAS